MAYYLVRATPDADLKTLKQQLNSGDIQAMQPFGRTLHHSLTNARLQDDGRWVWEEEDYCRPPLAMERRAVLDHYFTDLEVEQVEADEGWQRIQELPPAWEAQSTEGA